MFFEYNFPADATHLEPGLQAAYYATTQRVGARFDKLEKALALTGMIGEDFSHVAKVIFDNCFDKFERMSADELAATVTAMWDGTHQPKRLDWPNATVVFDCSFVSTKDWELFRHIGIGGSDCSVILGRNKHKCTYELYCDKKGIEPLIESTPNTAVFKRGHIMEDDVINTYCRMTGATRIPETRMFCSKQYPNSTANIDAILREADGNLIVFEAKSTIVDNFMPWTKGQVPMEYVPQTRQYPAVLNDERITATVIGVLFCQDVKDDEELLGVSFDPIHGFKWARLPRDTEAEQRQLEAEQDFWENHIAADIPPEIECRNADDALRVAHKYIGGPGNPNAPTIAITDDDAQKLMQKYLQLSLEKAQHTKAADTAGDNMKEIEKVFIQRLGSSFNGQMPYDPDSDKYVAITYNSVKDRKSIDFEKLEELYPEAYSKLVKTTAQNRRFRMTLKERSKAQAKKINVIV